MNVQRGMGGTTPASHDRGTLVTLVTRPCLGDCDADYEVSINDLIKGVSMALGNAPMGSCPAFDGDHDGKVAISELVGAVNRALNGCA